MSSISQNPPSKTLSETPPRIPFLAKAGGVAAAILLISGVVFVTLNAFEISLPPLLNSISSGAMPYYMIAAGTILGSLLVFYYSSRPQVSDAKTRVVQAKYNFKIHTDRGSSSQKNPLQPNNGEKGSKLPTHMPNQNMSIPSQSTPPSNAKEISTCDNSKPAPSKETRVIEIAEKWKDRDNSIETWSLTELTNFLEIPTDQTDLFERMLTEMYGKKREAYSATSLTKVFSAYLRFYTQKPSDQDLEPAMVKSIWLGRLKGAAEVWGLGSAENRKEWTLQELSLFLAVDKDHLGTLLGNPSREDEFEDYYSSDAINKCMQTVKEDQFKGKRILENHPRWLLKGML